MPGDINRLIKLNNKSVIGQIVVVIVSVEMLFLSSFVDLSLPVATQKNITAYLNKQALHTLGILPNKAQEIMIQLMPQLLPPASNVRFSTYVPTIPVAIFVGYVAGAFLGLVAAFLYLLLGLCAPFIGIYPFAEGGGIDYYLQPSFGYLIGIVAATWCSGYFTAKRRTSFRQMLAIITGLTVAHLIGLAYIFGNCFVSILASETFKVPQWQPWVFEEARNFTWYPLPYDIVFSIVAVGLGFPFRWLVKTLIAADIGFKSSNSQDKIKNLDLV